MALQRLQKILAQATSLSRRSAEEAIKNGLVKVNGKIVTKMGESADVDKDFIIYEGKRVREIQHRIYMACYKPRNTIVTKSDPEGRPTIWDRFPDDMRNFLNAAGRLDFESEGLLILTNDGELINALTHPKKEVYKTYQVKVGGILKDTDLAKLKSGLAMDEGKTLPAMVKVTNVTEDGNSLLEMSIREGKNRQIRKMLSSLGYLVRKLRRVSIGEIKLGILKPGEWRYLNKKEYNYIKGILASQK